MITANQNIGRMDRRIELRYPVETRDTDGGVLKGWAALDPVWAAFTPNTGRERFAAQAQFAEADAVFRIRHRTGIQATWRIIHDDAVYEVIAPPVEVGRREYIDIACTAIEQSNPDAGLPGADIFAVSQAFEVDLEVDSESVDVEYPLPFTASPSGLSVQLITPAGGSGFTVVVDQDSRTAAGFTVNLGALVPAAGYKLSIIAIP